MNTQQFQLDKPTSSQGRFSRLPYFAWLFLSSIFAYAAYIVMSVVAFIFGGSFFLIDEQSYGQSISYLFIAFIVLIFVIALAYSYFSIIFTIRRLHDFDKSGWWTLLTLIPVINLFFIIYVCLAKGTAGNNRFGAPRPTKQWEKIMGIIYLIFTPVSFAVILGIATAISLPAYQDYVQRAQDAQLQIQSQLEQYEVELEQR